MQKAKKQKHSLSYAFAFIAATIAITEFFTSYHYFEDGFYTEGYIRVALSLTTFVVCLVYMAFRIYSDEKARNNLRHPFFFFDWLESKIEYFKGGVKG